MKPSRKPSTSTSGPWAACLAVAMAFASPGMALAAAPTKINLQGVLRADLGGLEDGNFNFRVQIFADATTSTPLLDETYSSVRVSSGVFSIDVGGLTAGLASSLAAATDPHVQIGVNGVQMPRQPLGSVAYALHAQNAVSAATVPFAGVTGQPAACTGNTFLQGYAGGAAICAAPADTDTGVTSAVGASGVTASISGSGNRVLTLGLDGTVQRRTTAPSCAAGTNLQAIAADGTPTCRADTDTTGVLSVTASSPLASSGGLNPNLSLTGLVAVANGGTGAATAAQALSNLGGAPASGSTSYVQNQTGTTQAASLRIGGTVRLGNETGTGEPPDYPGTGLIHRRVRSTVSTAGSVVAVAGTVSLRRDGSRGGLSAVNVSGVTNPSVKCFVMSAGGAVSGRAVTVGAGATVVLIADADNIVMVQCQIQYSHPNASLDEGAVLQLARTSFADAIWSGFVTSTTNQ